MRCFRNRPAARRARWLLALAAVLVGAAPVAAGETNVAVAANFTDAAKAIAAAFERRTGHRAILSFGSTGLLYTQITQDAPFEVFLAADQERPAKLVAGELAVADTRFTYAVGRLVLFSRSSTLVTGAETLRAGSFSRLAIANPTTAPYGAAAIEAMKALGVHAALEAKLVRGNNIAQTYQFVYTGNAELGFVALAQVVGDAEGSRWIVPAELHRPMRQDAVLLARGAGGEAARAFVTFLREDEARAIIERFGYGTGG